MKRIEGEVEDDNDESEEQDVFLIFGNGGEQEEILFTAPSQPKHPTGICPPHPNTHFSSALLPVYMGYALHPLPTDSPPTFTNRQTLWENITGNGAPPSPTSASSVDKSPTVTSPRTSGGSTGRLQQVNCSSLQ
jgi:hypothetical protein